MPYLVSLHEDSYGIIFSDSFTSYGVALSKFHELRSYRHCGDIIYTDKYHFTDMICDNHKNEKYRSSYCTLTLQEYTTIEVPSVDSDLQDYLIGELVESYNSYLETIAEDHEDYLLYHVDSQNDYKWYMLQDIDIDPINSYLETLGLTVSENILEYLADNASEFTYVVPYSGYYGSNQSQDATKINVWHIDETDTQLEFEVPKYIHKHDSFWYSATDNYLIVGINGGLELHIDPNNLLDCIRDYVS